MRFATFSLWSAICLSGAAHPEAHPEAHPKAYPEAHPNARPEAHPNAHPEAHPAPLPQPHPKPVPQEFTNNAPFSGAIYIVYPNGQEITAAETNQCPQYAAQSCGNVGYPSWCCPNTHTCGNPENANVCGCCPEGSNCGGTVEVASVTTVTVLAQQQTEVVYVQPPPTTKAVYANPHTHPPPQQGGFCQTIVMDGPNLPTTREGECGTILIVSSDSPSFKPMGYGYCATILLIQLALGRLFNLI